VKKLADTKGATLLFESKRQSVQLSSHPLPTTNKDPSSLIIPLTASLETNICLSSVWFKQVPNSLVPPSPSKTNIWLSPTTVINGEVLSAPLRQFAQVIGE
jgi:hypothetical protein